MRINVFGVGRSGTKAVMLYLLYHLAKKEKSVKSNYEPYAWAKRGVISLEGIHIDQYAPYFIGKEENITTSHKNYLQKLLQGNGSIVTKFIHGTGRMPKINEVMKPDYTFFIIRDVFGVLKSISKFTWELYTSHSDEKKKYIDWKRLLDEARNHELLDSSLLPILAESDDRMLRNATYWYLTNKFALKNNVDIKNYYILSFDNISSLNSIGTQLFETPENIESPKFFGQNISADYPMKYINKNSGLERTFINAFRANPSLGTKILPTQLLRVGDILELADDIDYVSPIKTNKKKENLSGFSSDHSLITKFNQEIFSLLRVLGDQDNK